MALFSNGGAKIPHHLRMVILLLRVALGLDFFYLGWTALFNAPLAKDLSARSLGDLYAWLVAGPWGLGTAIAWVFVIVGVCLAAGLLTRTASIAAIALTAISYWPHLANGTLGAATLANSEVIAAIGLLILIFSNAGAYLGLDTFLHIHLSAKHKG